MILQNTLRKDVAVPLQSQGTMRILSCIDSYHNLKQPSETIGIGYIAGHVMKDQLVPAQYVKIFKEGQ
jgi:hypothetical protein